MQDTEKLEKAVTLHRVNKEVSSKGKFEQRDEGSVALHCGDICLSVGGVKSFSASGNSRCKIS